MYIEAHSRLKEKIDICFRMGEGNDDYERARKELPLCFMYH